MRQLACLLAGAALALSGCGLHPLYSNGSSGAAGRALSDITVGPIEGRAGWLVRNAIVDRIGENGNGARYQLNIKLDDNIEGLGIRPDSTTTRERRTLRARYTLIDTQGDKIMIDATTGSDVGIDVVGSEYATIAAEQTALERLSERIADDIVARIAVNARKQAAATP